jgi:hypothetical protein
MDLGSGLAVALVRWQQTRNEITPDLKQEKQIFYSISGRAAACISPILT